MGLKRDGAGFCSLGLRKIQHHELGSLLVVNRLHRVAGLWTIGVQVNLQNNTGQNHNGNNTRDRVFLTKIVEHANIAPVTIVLTWTTKPGATDSRQV